MGFAPSLFAALTDNDEKATYDADGLRDRDEDVLLKLNLPLLARWGKATFEFNPTVLLHEMSFGGGNVQLRIPF